MPGSCPVPVEVELFCEEEVVEEMAVDVVGELVVDDDCAVTVEFEEVVVEDVGDVEVVALEWEVLELEEDGPRTSTDPCMKV